MMTPDRIFAARRRLAAATGAETVPADFVELALGVGRRELWQAVKVRKLGTPFIEDGRRVWRTRQVLRALERAAA